MTVIATILGRAVAKTAIVMGLLVLAYLFATVFATDDPNESAELANKLHLANVWALKANLEAVRVSATER